MMNMKLILSLIIIIIVATIVVIFGIRSTQRQYDDVLMEMVLWSANNGTRGLPIYYFIVTNDSRLFVYRGRSRRNSDDTMSLNVVRAVRERAWVALDEDDFLHISELVSGIVEGNERYAAITHTRITFLYNGYIYENTTAWSRPLMDLLNTIRELSPISTNSADF